ncbi:MAG TPA: caspase family protein [Polyangia bacterium]
MIRLVRFVFAFSCLCWATAVHAAVDRYAVILGNDLGARDEPRLRFAESDAAKLYEALREIGGFPPENLVLLQGGRPETARNALIATNARVRDSVSAGRQAVLVVYYSGHADADALHLGDGRFGLREIEALVQGSAANFRLLVLDACRSGALTQAKGGTRAPPFPIQIEQWLAGEGAVVLTSSAVNEDAQESDAVGGSFFTHYFVSGLLGAADHNDDGQVSIEEVYRFAYDSTLRASSRSLIGTQHPTFRYDLRGQGTLPLTFPFRSEGRAEIRFPEGLGFLVLRDNGDGPVVAEIGVADRVRRLSLRPGRYFVRGRGRDHLREGIVALNAGERALVDEQRLERVAYARLVRKGGAEHASIGLEGGLALASPFWTGGGLCRGGFLAGAFALPRLTLGLRGGACRSDDRRDYLVATADLVSAEARLLIEWDLRHVVLSAGIGAGASLVQQSFATRGQAPDRLTAGATVAALGRARVALGRRPYLTVEVAGETLVLQEDRHPNTGTRLGARAGARVSLGFGLHLR